MYGPGFVYLFEINRYNLYYEDVEAIKKSKGRLKMNYDNLERDCIYKLGISKDINNLYKRMNSHLRCIPELSNPGIRLLFAVYVPDAYKAEYDLKQYTCGREWITKEDLKELLTEP